MTKIKMLNIQVFSYLVTAGEIDFITQEQASELDEEYRYGHSANKPITPYMDNMIAIHGEEEALTRAYKKVAIHFKDKWTRLYNAYVQENYNPLENYSATETEEYQTKVETDTTTDGDAYGFGSDEASPLSKTTIHNTTSSDPEHNTRHLTRSGNIGVTTSQQMLQSELDLRKWDYYDNLFRDVDSILASDIYI